MSEQKSIFRKVSLDRLSSPEQLDQKLTVVSPAGWAALAALTALILAALAWGVFGSISNTVPGAGILMYEGGIFTLTSHTRGQITEVSVSTGQHVDEGQVVARVLIDDDYLEDINTQIRRYEENLAALEGIDDESIYLDINSLNSEIYVELSQIAAMLRSARSQHADQKAELERNAERNEQEIANQRQRQTQLINGLEQQIALLEANILQYQTAKDSLHTMEIAMLSEDLAKAIKNNEDAEILFEAGVIPRVEFDAYSLEVSRIEKEIEARQEAFYSYDSGLVSMESQLESYRIQLIQAQTLDTQLESTLASNLEYNQTADQILSLTQQFARRKQVIEQDLRRELRNLEERRSRLEAQHEKDSVITASYSGIMSGLNIQPYDFVQNGSVIGTIVREGDTSTPTSVVLYVPLDKGMLISEGMDVHISPATVNREEHGYINGYVSSVSVYAVTLEQMMATLQNQQLVQSFGGRSAVVEVGIQLLADESTVSGYMWSTPAGAPFTINPGTICVGEIKVSSQRPIDMVLPFIKRMFGGSSGGAA
ncbi:MAG: NHLP bacteriocin system secretion protein [Defluviitaleaceae bacterium]|nr:NHLP bacteriocin system secretion protein [Defluviitaleaceae bacterium]